MKDNGHLTFKQQLRLTAFAMGLSSIIFLIVGVGNIVRQQAAERGAARVATRRAGEVARVEETAVSPTSAQAVFTPFPTITPTHAEPTIPTRTPTIQIDNNRPFGSEDLNESLMPSPTPRATYNEAATATSPPPQDINQLVNSLSMEQIQLNNGFQTSRVNGGWYGYRREYYCDGPYRWLDNNHLMLNPVLGYTNWFENPVGGELTQPVILDLNVGAPWAMDTPLTDICELPVWSESRQQLIEASDGNVRLRNLSGEVIQTYSGSYPIHIAPSGQRILAGLRWIDLATGENVVFSKLRTNYPIPAWAVDERRFFNCCFSYGDVDSGEYWHLSDLPGMLITGMGIGPGYIGMPPHWVADDTAVMVEPSALFFQRNDNQPIIPVIDPLSKTFEDAIARLDFPDKVSNCYPHIAPTGDYFWVSCDTVMEQEDTTQSRTTYLVNLPSWETTAVSGEVSFRSWSPDGRFVVYFLLDKEDGDHTTWLMRARDGYQIQIADFPASSALWTSNSQTVALYRQGGNTIQFINADDENSWSVEVNEQINYLAWQPNNVGMLMVIGDRELHWMPDMKTDVHQPLTPASMPVESVKWSPDGSKISFIAEQELFIIGLAQPIEPDTESNGRSNTSVISQDGNIVAFISTGNLTGNAGGETLSVFVRDVAAGTTKLVNITTEGVAGVDNVYNVAMSGNGRYIAYYSIDNSLASEPCTQNCAAGLEDLFIYDRETQLTQRIPRGRNQGLGADYTVALSTNGRFVAYGEDGQLIIYDLTNNTATPAFTTIDNEPPNNFTFAPQFANNGDIAFVSYASNLVANDYNGVADVFIRHHNSGIVERVTVAADGAEGNNLSGAVPFSEGASGGLSISANGRFIAYASLATNLTDDDLLQCDDPRFSTSTRSCYNIFLYDRETGTTRLVSSIWGAGDGDSTQPSLSDDGRYLVFTSYASNFFLEPLPSCGQYCGQIYLLDLESTLFISLSQNPDEPQGNSDGSWKGQVSGNGRYVTFVSVASNLIENDTNNASDVFRYDIQTEELERVSLNNLP